MVEYSSFVPSEADREAALQAVLDVAKLIDYSSLPGSNPEEQRFLYLSNPHSTIPNIDPLATEDGEIIIKVDNPDDIVLGKKKNTDVVPILLGEPQRHVNNSPDIQSELIQSGIWALPRGRSVLGVHIVGGGNDTNSTVHFFEKPIPDLSQDEKEEIAGLYETREREPSLFDRQLVHNPYVHSLYPRRTAATQEGFVPMGKIDHVGIPGAKIRDDLKDFFGRPADNQEIRLPRLGSLYSYYRLLQAGFDTRIVEAENPLPFKNYLPNPNAFAIMARPQAANG